MVAIDAERLRHWLSCVRSGGLAVVQALPDAWLLPVSEGGTTLVSLEESYWLRFPRQRWRSRYGSASAATE
jgi:general secretion pathway protein L